MKARLGWTSPSAEPCRAVPTWAERAGPAGPSLVGPAQPSWLGRAEPRRGGPSRAGLVPGRAGPGSSDLLFPFCSPSVDLLLNFC